jgi:flagellar biosynthesis/type III secretory pathway chaperone
MDAALCREHLRELLREELGLLQQLHSLLEQERSVIGSGDLKSLERTTALRQERMAALASTDEQRRALCRMHGESPDAPGLQRLLLWCDPGKSLAAAVQQCRAQALQCRQLNDRNGLMVSARLKRVDARLQALRSRADRTVTYGPGAALDTERTPRALGAV